MIDFYLEHHELDMIVARLSVVMQFSKLAAEVLPLIFVKSLPWLPSLAFFGFSVHMYMQILTQTELLFVCVLGSIWVWLDVVEILCSIV